MKTTSLKAGLQAKIMSQIKTTNLRFEATQSSGEVSAILMRPENARWLLVLGHGAGTGMRHSFMEVAAQQLAQNGIATFRYQFQYIEQGRKSPNPLPILMKTVRSAVAAASKATGDLPLMAGGKALGGRMTSSSAAKEPLPGVKGIIFFGFPLHAPGRPSNDRAAHLYDVHLPMLFLQGTRDKFADLEFLKPVCDKLGTQATLHTIEWADHGFHVPKKSGRTDEEVIEELGKTAGEWIAKLG